MQPNQYPPQQGYPPQGYAPQAQYPPQQGYPPQYQQGYAAPPASDEFGSPDSIGGRARFADAGPGRLILVSPVKLERDVPNRLAQPDATGKLPTQDRMTADVVFLDGPPFMYGGDPQGENGPPRPHTMTASIPHEVRGMRISNVLIVSQCERSLPPHPGAQGGKVLGRLVKGEPSKPGLRPPWKLDDPTDADRQIARDYLRAVQEGRIAPPTPAPGQTTAAPGTVTYAASGSGGYPPQMTYSVGVGGQQGAAAAYIGDPNAGAQYAPAPQGQQPPTPPAYGGIGGGYAPEGHTGASAGPNLDVPPPGWTPEVWANIPGDQRQMIYAASAPTPGI